MKNIIEGIINSKDSIISNVLNSVTFESFQVTNIQKGIEEKILCKLEEFESNVDSRLNELLQIYPLLSKANEAGVEELKTVIQTFDSELNNILSYSNFVIIKQAVSELLRSRIDYGNKCFHNIIHEIFKVVNNNVKPKAVINSLSSIKGLKEIELDHKMRMYYINNPNIIIGFDFTHNKSNHNDVLNKLDGRYKSYTSK